MRIINRASAGSFSPPVRKLLAVIYSGMAEIGLASLCWKASPHSGGTLRRLMHNS